MNGYWCEPDNGILGYGDGRIPRLGATHSVKGEPRIRSWGLHGCRHPWDAYINGSGNHLWKVRVVGELDLQREQFSGLYRRYTAGPIHMAKPVERWILWLNRACGELDITSYDRDVSIWLKDRIRIKSFFGREYISNAVMDYLGNPNRPQLQYLYTMSQRYVRRERLRLQFGRYVRAKLK